MQHSESFNFSDVSTFYYTSAQLTRIQSTQVGIAGAGGLGSNCVLALVRSGFQNFVIADFDKVSLSNLNRQQYFPDDIGKYKVECLEKLIRRINPTAKCLIYTDRITKENVRSLFLDCQCIVEAFDNAESKAMLAEEYIASDKLLVSVSGIGGYGKTDRIITRKVRDNFYLIGDGISEVGENKKPFAPCVMVAAAKQADVVLEWCLDQNKLKY